MIPVKTEDQLDRMRRAGRIVRHAMVLLKKKARPGITTAELDCLAADIISAQGGRPAFRGYRGYPANICTSLNETIVHGIPGNAALEEGDILSIDIGVEYEGCFADAAVTIPVGRINEEKKRLIKAARECLALAVRQARPGRRLGDISWTIQSYAESFGFNVVRQFVGHGIGTSLHEEPEIPNFGRPGEGPVLAEGMTLAIEPMINAGTEAAEILSDGWTAVTKDRRPSAHFEHTVCVRNRRAEILT